MKGIKNINEVDFYQYKMPNLLKRDNNEIKKDIIEKEE
jgi:hypothetical protein